MRSQIRNSGKALMVLKRQHKETKTSRFPCFLPEVGGWGEGVSWSLGWREPGGGSVVWPEGWLRCSACPLGSAACRVLRHPSKVTVGVLVSLYLIVRNSSPPHTAQLFFIPLLFLCICCSGRCLSRYKYCSRESQVPPCVSSTLSLTYSSPKFPNAVFSKQSQFSSWRNLKQKQKQKQKHFLF